MGKQGRVSVPLFRFAALVLCSLALQGIPFLFTRMEGDGGVLLYLIHLYAVLPLCALAAPFWAGQGGVHPFAGCLPIGGTLMILPVYESPGMGLLCILLSLIGCVAGQEWEKRKNPKKGKRHGGKRKV
ncbi:MAG: hypothetical protein IJ189_05505 [Clostridia bacterium]|nr:hypothetical protein [Clostridia bacterium]